MSFETEMTEYELKYKIREYIRDNLGLSIEVDTSGLGGNALCIKLILDNSEICKDWVYLDEIVGS